MIIVTGATGTIGSELLRLLSERGLEVKAISRHPHKGKELPGIIRIAADLRDAERLPQIFSGADSLFLLTGNTDDMVLLQKNAIAAAEKAGIPHVVKLSALGASDHSLSVIGVWHYIVEQALRSTQLNWTILRPHVFMQNLLNQWSSIQTEGKIYSPSGEARLPMIDTRDIAAVAVEVLIHPARHNEKRYILTGPQAISLREATAVLEETLKKHLTYLPETEDEAWQRLRKAGLAPWHIGAQLALAYYQRQGGGTQIITNNVAKVANKTPYNFRDFARDHARLFKQDQ